MISRKKQKQPFTDLKVLRAKDGDIIVVKESMFANYGQRYSFVEKFGEIVNAHALILFVENLGDIRILDEGQMNRAGWFRKQDETN